MTKLLGIGRDLRSKILRIEFEEEGTGEQYRIEFGVEDTAVLRNLLTPIKGADDSASRFHGPSKSTKH